MCAISGIRPLSMKGESKIELIESRTRFFSTSYLYQRGFDLLPFETVRAMIMCVNTESLKGEERQIRSKFTSDRGWVLTWRIGGPPIISNGESFCPVQLQARALPISTTTFQNFSLSMSLTTINLFLYSIQQQISYTENALAPSL
jgi:hypothetical protein